MAKDPVGLSQLVFDVKLSLQSAYELPLWVVAEISELNINRSGHCYLELIEKDTISDRIIAKTRATIWAFAFRTIKPYFETSTGETLRSGLKVLLKVSIEFHEVFGFSLNVKDIDPQYTLGDLARKKAEIIQHLDNDGVLEMNKSIPFPTLPQRIAVISSETAAGYGDFCDQLKSNQNAYYFKVELFPAIMQGEKASESIIQSLNLIFDRIDDFDLVAIMRGGGSKSDLNCFDNYDLAYFITQFPLPIITGIGHERDDTVTDLVAHTRLKTPTAVAEFLIAKFIDLDDHLQELKNSLEEAYAIIIENASDRLSQSVYNLDKALNFILQKNSDRLERNKIILTSAIRKYGDNKQYELVNYTRDLKSFTKGFFSKEAEICKIRQIRINKWSNNYIIIKNNKLNSLQETLSLIDPKNILKRGYAIVSYNNKVLSHSKHIKKGDCVKVTLNSGSFESEVTNIND
ncbi:MAG: exodeoxyribonuclease VII large subunit [Salinivirgaceae bacterium]|nr:exodeoxyribonuclease VII large subunit [Salinivirgaceae bacterium]